MRKSSDLERVVSHGIPHCFLEHARVHVAFEMATVLIFTLVLSFSATALIHFVHAKAHDARLRLRRSEVCLDQVFPTTRTVRVAPRTRPAKLRRRQSRADHSTPEGSLSRLPAASEARTRWFQQRAPRPDVPRSRSISARVAATPRSSQRIFSRRISVCLSFTCARESGGECSNGARPRGTDGVPRVSTARARVCFASSSMMKNRVVEHTRK